MTRTNNPASQAKHTSLLTISGNNNTVTVLGGHADTNMISSPPAPETWWTRWRKRGLIIGTATVLGTVVTVLTWLNWTL